MIKKIIFLSLLIFLFSQSAFAAKIPMKISPIQLISTEHDEVEIGDWVKFTVVNDIYVDNKLYIPKNSYLFGIVDFIHPNGWMGDSAQITFKEFYTKDTLNNKVTIYSPLVIDGMIKEINDYKQFLKALGSCLTRGREIYIEPDEKVYNIFIER